MLHIPVSVGELLDKITILEIKAERISERAKLHNIRRELDALHNVRLKADLKGPDLEKLMHDLKHVNMQLWDIEDDIRMKETAQDFDNQFIELARAVYITNDRRADIKRKINELTESAFIEEKSYAS